MFCKALYALIFFAAVELAYAAPNAQVVGPAPGTPLGYSQIAVTTATALSPPAGANVACLGAEAQALRWRDDGTAPTASTGFLMAVGASFCYKSLNLAALRFIATVSGGVLDVAYYQQ